MTTVEDLIEEGRRSVAGSLREAFDAGVDAAAREAKDQVTKLTASAASVQDGDARLTRRHAEEMARREDIPKDQRSTSGARDDPLTSGFLFTPFGLFALFALATLAIWRCTLL
jgi:hypothetical protein